jgi:serine protease Do
MNVRIHSLLVVLLALVGTWLSPLVPLATAQTAPAAPSTRSQTAPPTTRQPRNRTTAPAPSQNGKSAANLIRTLTPVTERVHRSVAALVVDGKDVAYATVVRPDGYLVTKASEITGEKISVRFDGSRTALPAKLVGVVKAHDLAMVKVDSASLIPVEWADPASVRVGQMVVAVSSDRPPLGLGVISVGRRPTTGGFLGVELMQTAEGIRVNNTTRGMPAEKAGILPGDFIVGINDQRFEAREDLSEYLQLQTAGTEVSVTILRNGEEIIYRVTLAQRPLEQSARARDQNRMGSELSERRTDFPAILQHDTVLQRWQQGGPLINLDGKAVGINIARAGRVETYALPVEVVQALIPELVSGVYPATTRPVEAAVAEAPRAPELDAVQESLRTMNEEVEKAISTAEEGLARLAQEQRELAERDLDRLRKIRLELTEVQKSLPGPETDAMEKARRLAEHADRLRKIAEEIRSAPVAPGR